MARILAFVLILTSGCSFVAVRGAPAVDPGMRPVNCPRSRVAPVIDTLPAVVFLGAGVTLIAVAVSAGTSNRSADVGPGALLLPGIASSLVGLPYALSAWYGFSRTGGCREMNNTMPSLPPATPH